MRRVYCFAKMFFSGKKSDKALRKRAENLLISSEKVLRYRGDIFDESERERFDEAVSEVKKELAGTPFSPESLEEKSAELESVLSELGGTIFPQKKLPEWVELIIVAAILAGGIRAFFIQPFKIPTNSMFPTYNGMTSEICTGAENVLGKWAERIFRSASFYEIKSPSSGEVLIPLRRDANGRGLSLLPPEKDGATGTVISPGQDVYSLYVGGNRVPVSVPREFSLNAVLLKTFFPDADDESVPEALRWREVFKNAQLTTLPDGSPALRTGKRVRAGENLLNFKILGGDMVLVNRMSYHFLKPDRGDPFVFRTRNIPGLNNVELYYIKRLSGLPGDVLRVDNGKLFVNGVPAGFSEAVVRNNAPTPREKYYGYLPTSGAPSPYSWQLTQNFRVPEGFFYALGDNSANSYDSRGWGGVPEDDIVGSALFILYPFSSRWGLAK